MDKTWSKRWREWLCRTFGHDDYWVVGQDNLPLPPLQSPALHRVQPRGDPMTDEPNIKNDDRLAGGGVQRFRMDAIDGDECSMAEGWPLDDPSGDWVRYPDHAALCRRMEALAKEWRERADSWGATYEESRETAHMLADELEAALAHDAQGSKP